MRNIEYAVEIDSGRSSGVTNILEYHKRVIIIIIYESLRQTTNPTSNGYICFHCYSLNK
jgi:hypothetical protein